MFLKYNIIMNYDNPQYVNRPRETETIAFRLNAFCRRWKNVN